MHVTKLILIAVLLASTLFAAGPRGAAADPLPSVEVIATDGLLGVRIHTVPIGRFLTVDAGLSFLDIAFLDGARSLPATRYDVYIGTILPDGRFVSWTGDPRGATFATDTRPVPLLANILPATTAQYFQRHIPVTAADPLGWRVLYALAVRAGADPLDPREWSGWNATSFFPVLVVPPAQ